MFLRFIKKPVNAAKDMIFQWKFMLDLVFAMILYQPWNFYWIFLGIFLVMKEIKFQVNYENLLYFLNYAIYLSLNRVVYLLKQPLKDISQYFSHNKIIICQIKWKKKERWHLFEIKRTENHHFYGSLMHIKDKVFPLIFIDLIHVIKKSKEISFIHH